MSRPLWQAESKQLQLDLNASEKEATRMRAEAEAAREAARQAAHELGGQLGELTASENVIVTLVLPCYH